MKDGYTEMPSKVESQLVQQIIGLGKAIEQLHRALDQLENRLSPVLRPDATLNTAQPEPPTMLVERAHQISEAAAKVDDATQLVIRVCERLEV